MAQGCPKCASKRIDKKNHGTKAFAVVGGAAFTKEFLTKATTEGAKVGAAIGLRAGTVGAAVGAVAGGVMGAVTAFGAGAVAGAAVGKIVDTKILDNCKCMECGYSFAE